MLYVCQSHIYGIVLIWIGLAVTRGRAELLIVRSLSHVFRFRSVSSSQVLFCPTPPQKVTRPLKSSPFFAH